MPFFFVFFLKNCEISSKFHHKIVRLMQVGGGSTEFGIHCARDGDESERDLGSAGI